MKDVLDIYYVLELEDIFEADILEAVEVFIDSTVV